MRYILIAVAVLLTLSARSQNFWRIDNHALSVEAGLPDELSRKLTAPYTTDLEKFRAIFIWVAAHIEYKPSGAAFAMTQKRSAKYNYDTTWESRSLDERVAYLVLKNRVAVCDGYARLLKTLCDYAGISCNVVYGFAKTGEKSDRIFSTNHTWNAVYIDSAWQLADVTWASGYVSPFTNEYVRKYDDYYFLTPPKNMILNHYPEDPRWSLLDRTPFLNDFDHAPFRLKAFQKLRILSFAPTAGHLKGKPGDTIQIKLVVDELPKTEDHSLQNALPHFSLPGEEYLYPSLSESKKEIYYTWIVQPGIEWLNILYKDDIIMRYRMEVMD